MAKVIRENDIDIIGLQEAAIYFDEDEKRNIAKEIAEELDYHYTFYPALDFRPKKPYTMGNAVISRYPIENSEAHELNPEDLEYDGTYQTEPRIVAETEISTEDGRISFLTTHLQYSYRFKISEIRKSQVQNLLSVIGDIGVPTILTGDFNSTPENPEIKRIENKLHRIGDDEPTWTVHPFEHEGWEVENLEYRLDNVFISQKAKCKNVKVIESELSDHLPVKTTLNIEN